MNIEDSLHSNLDLRFTTRDFCLESGQFLPELRLAYETYGTLATHTAMRRWGRMEEIETAVLFLAAETSGYVTGAMIPVDGGWTVQ